MKSLGLHGGRSALRKRKLGHYRVLREVRLPRYARDDSGSQGDRHSCPKRHIDGVSHVCNQTAGVGRQECLPYLRTA